MKKVTLHDKVFRRILSRKEIQRSIRDLSVKLNQKWQRNDTVPLFLSVLNGAFIFTSELLQQIDFPCEVSFIRLASYTGTDSSGKVTELLGLTESIEGRDVIVIEDIIETGNTIECLDNLLREKCPASITYVTLLFKPEAYAKQIKIDHYAMQLPNEFVVGFGLDYNQQGRNLNGLYTLISDNAK